MEERSILTGSGGERGGGGGVGGFTLPPTSISNEDIIFCIDVGPESALEMKPAPNGKPITRIESIKQAILLFIHSKLTINPDHRFAFATIGKSASWLKKEFSSDADSANAALRGLSIDLSASHADLTQLFRVAAHEAKKSRAQNRILRLVLIYCRSSTPALHQWVAAQKLFTLDVIYIHDKPGPDNCPQKVYDALVEALENVGEYEGYIFEIGGQGLTRILFRHMCVLLAHPQQRCPQDDVDFPKPLTKKSPLPETVVDETVPMSSQ